MERTTRTPLWTMVVTGFFAAGAARSACAWDVPPGAREILRRHELTLDPAEMNARELRLLPGVGPRRALAIQEGRRRHRPETGPLDWTAIPGIGPRTHAGIRRWLEERGQDPGAHLVPGTVSAAHGPRIEAPHARPPADDGLRDER